MTSIQRKPRMLKTAVNSFVTWFINNDEQLGLAPKNIVKNYKESTGIELQENFVRNIKRMVKFHKMLQDIECNVSNDEVV